MCKAFISLIVFVLLLGCQKENDNEASTLATGRYVGTFSRTGMDTSNIVLEIVGNKFSGSSDKARYPAICAGTYELRDNTINFADTCNWTADFDWTLITDGTFEYNTSENMIIIRKRQDQSVDEYRLRKLAR